MTLLLAAVLLAAAQQQPQASGRFAQISRQALEAREQERWADAERLYREGVKLRPEWKEGWWYLGTMSYDQNRYEAARAALRRFTILDPNVAAGWAFLGLCEYETKKYDDAQAHLEQALMLRLNEDSQLSIVTRYHAVLLRIRSCQFEAALAILMRFAEEQNERPEFVEAAGLAALRKPLLPHELRSSDRELVLEVGRAVMDTGARRAAKAQKDFEELIAAYPTAPNLHYLFGSFLLTSDPEAGLAELKKELEISRQHAPTLVQIAFEYLKRGDPEAALQFARKATAADPQYFVTHCALGRVLMESGDIQAGIRELEICEQQAPGEPQTHIALASAYAKAGRNNDAARERTEFLKLKQLTKSPGEQ